MDLGKAIRRARQRRTLKQKELADLIEVSQTTMSLIESNKTWPSKKTLDSISEKTDTPLSIIFIMAIEGEVVPIEHLLSIKPMIKKIVSHYLEYSKSIKVKVEI